MTPEITEEMRQAVKAGDQSRPIPVIDRLSNTRYVLLRADVYDQLRRESMDDDPRASYPFVDEVMAEDDKPDPFLQDFQDLPPDARAS
jgi:hypothetical protein